MKILKKKFLVRLSILSCLLLFALSGYTFASWSQGEFEYKVSQVLDIATNNSSRAYTTAFSQFINSNVYNEYKNQIPFDEYDNLWFCIDTSYGIRIRLLNANTTFYVNNSQHLVNNSALTYYEM